MEINYEMQIAESASQVFEAMKDRVSDEQFDRIVHAYMFAKEAHKLQKRKSGEPYIMHPIAVARIAAVELKLDANSVCASFLHDVVEDTETTVEEIEEVFGADVAFLVDVVTKRKEKRGGAESKQVANYQQLLSSVHYDIRALMVKIADRLHNMRTLGSMRPDKQMKIAGETDYFYAPLANRLGLFDVKTDLENLSFHYRCPLEFKDLKHSLDDDAKQNEARLKCFTDTVRFICKRHGIEAKVGVYYRKPYSIWRRMKMQNCDFKHIANKYYVRVTFNQDDYSLLEKDMCLKIYSILTSEFKEKPMSFNNQIDCAKENSYKSLNVMLLSQEGVWEDVQICSDRMVESSKVGCMAGLDQSKVGEWIEKFKMVLKDIGDESQEASFLEKVATTLYYDDVMVFTPQGRGIILPKGATAIDFAFELHTQIGVHAKYARINGRLSSMKTVLNRGDCVEIATDPDSFPKMSWQNHCCSYKAKRALRNMLETGERKFRRCPYCRPLPGGETIGFKQSDNTIVIHRRSCMEAIRLASKHGDSIVDVELCESPDTHYPVTVTIKAVDRYHLLIDLIDNITNKLHLSIDSLNTVTKDDIVDCTITFFIHSVVELMTVINELNAIDGVDAVQQVTNKDEDDTVRACHVKIKSV